MPNLELGDCILYSIPLKNLSNSKVGQLLDEDDESLGEKSDIRI